MVYRNRLGLILESKRKKKGTRPSITSDDVERDMDMRQLVAYGKGNMGKREEKKGRKEGNIPQTQAHQVIWEGWQIHPPYA